MISMEELHKITIESFKDAKAIEKEVQTEKELHERAMSEQDMKEAFERLGITKKLEDIKPDLDLCKCLMRLGPPLRMDDGLASALRRIIDFIECIDEP